MLVAFYHGIAIYAVVRCLNEVRVYFSDIRVWCSLRGDEISLEKISGAKRYYSIIITMVAYHPSPLPSGEITEHRE